MTSPFKLTGFFKEHNPKAQQSLLMQQFVPCVDKDLLLNYFDKAHCLAVTMGHTYSQYPTSKGEWLREGTAYFTDGTWFWPGYMVAYFRMHDLVLDKHFLQHIQNQNYTVLDLTTELESETIQFLKQSQKNGFAEE
jgi:hypothetical protein